VAKITYLPSNITCDVPPEVNLRDASLTVGLEIASTCGGVGSCGLCKVKITAGAEHLAPMTPLEVGKLGNVFFITKERLSCQTRITGDVVCEVPDEAGERAKRALKAKESYRDRTIERSRQKTEKTRR
jgi:2Fe-2S ferredoxin